VWRIFRNPMRRISRNPVWRIDTSSDWAESDGQPADVADGGTLPASS